MRKYSAAVLSILTLSSLGLVLSSCDKDDEPTKYQLSFSETSITVDESDGLLEVELSLDKPAPEDITIKYSLTGTAYDDVRAGTEYYSDFFVDDSDYEYGEIEIEEGETSGVITMIMYSDDFLEDDETIEVTIDDVESTKVEYDENERATIFLTQEDGMIVLLAWPSAGLTGVADMDLFVRIGENTASPVWDGILSASYYRGFDSDYEFIFLPKTFVGNAFPDLDYTNTVYGLSYTYYDGNLNPLDFTVTYIEFTNGNLEAEANRQVFEESYTLANLNKWVAPTAPTIIAQTFVNNNGVFSNVSAVTIPETSSRIDQSSMNKVFSIGKKKQNTLQILDSRTIPGRLKEALHLN